MDERREAMRQVGWCLVAAMALVAVGSAWAHRWGDVATCAAAAFVFVPILLRDRRDQEEEEAAAAALTAGEVLDPPPADRDSRFAYVPARPVDR